jgi:RNA polymerase sigma-70 factor (ECF subfamily)
MLRPTSTNTIDAPAKRELVEAALMRRIARGEPEALTELYERLYQPLYGVALLILRDGAEAEDIVQEVFVVVWRKAGQFSSGRGSVFSWAATLTRNRAIDCVRRRNRLSALLEDNRPPQDGPGGDSRGVRREADDADDAHIVRCALISLPGDERTVLEMAFFAGLSHLEIAQRLEQPHGTIKSRIRRGLTRLRSLLAQSGFRASTAGADAEPAAALTTAGLGPFLAPVAPIATRSKRELPTCASPSLRNVALRLNLRLP